MPDTPCTICTIYQRNLATSPKFVITVPGKADRTLARLCHDRPGGSPGFLVRPGGGDKLDHGGVVGRVAGVGHYKSGLVVQIS